MRSSATRYSAATLFVLLMLSVCFQTGFASDQGDVYDASLQSAPAITSSNGTDASIINVLVGAGTSGNSRAPQGSQRYIRTIYFIAPSEMAAAGFPTGADINLIGFNYAAAQSITTTGSFLVYLENTADVTFTKPSSLWADLIAPMTLAHSGNVTIPAATGNFDIPFAGAPTFTYTGGGLYVAFEYQNPTDPLSTANTANCNTAIASGLKNAFSTTALPTSVGAFSAFRPYTRLGTSLNDLVQVPVIYSLGKIPVPLGNPDVINVPVLNVSASPLTFDVTATVKRASDGTVRFTNTQPVTGLAGGTTQIVSFPGWSPTILEGDSIIINTSVIVGEDITSNNRVAMLQSVNPDVFSHSQGTVAAGGVGFTGATGDFVAKFVTAGPTMVDQVQVNFSAGGQPYNIGIWDATGTGGSPGTNIYTSGGLTSATGVVVVPINPPVPVNGPFFIGVKQTGTTNISFSYQGENPFRAGTFYFTSPTGGTTWTDFSPNNQFRFMIEPRIVNPPPPADTLLVIYQDSTTGTTTNQGYKKADRDTTNKYLSMISPEPRKTVYIDSAGTNFPNLDSYKRIVYVETSFDNIQTRHMGVSSRTALKNWLNAGTPSDRRRLVMFGADLGYNYSRTGSTGLDTMLAHQMLKYVYVVDNGNTSGSVTGLAVNAGQTFAYSTTTGGFWPDGCNYRSGGTPLYKYTGRATADSNAAIGYVGTGYTSACVFQDPRYYTGTFGPVLQSALQYAGVVTDVETERMEIPSEFTLAQNYPNPFNPTTTIQYGLPNAATISLKVYNILGQEVATLANGLQTAGVHQAIWDGRNSAGANVSTGVYFYRLEARSGSQGSTFTTLKKMILVK